MRAGFVLAAILYATAASADGTSQTAGGAFCGAGSTAMDRVDLYFGAVGSRAAWRHFVAEVVTPRFPAGLTILDGHGQWRGPRGLERDATHIIVIYYRRDESSDARIDTIRTVYEARFRQTSVLRADSIACVSF